MNGFITKNTWRLFFAAAGFVSLIGCYGYKDLVDPCWPERYNYMAAKSIREMANAQSDKGHMLEQTLWNWHFERDEKTGAPTDRLNGAGQETLRRITRTLPAPDFHLFLQNAQDIPYVEGVAPDKLVNAREQLNRRRIDSILRFLGTQPPIAGGGIFQVAVHDFAPTDLPGTWNVMTRENVIEKNVKSGLPQFFQPPIYNSK